jgi:hypothetical protein
MTNRTQRAFSDLQHLLEQPNTPEPVLRDRFQTYFDEITGAEKNEELETDLANSEAFRKGLSLLRRYYNRELPKEDAPVSLDIADLCETLSFCCDLLCGADAPVPAVCSPRALSWALLNLLSNAVLYSTGKYVFVFVQETENNIVLRVSNEGAFSRAQFEKAVGTTGGGLWFAERAARAHGGALLCLLEPNYTTLALTVSKKCPDDYPLFPPESFADLLSDRLSPVYTAFCDVCALYL